MKKNTKDKKTMYKETFQDRLKTARIQKGYTQKEVCEILKISQTNLCRYEKGKREPDIETLGALIDLYEIPARWVIATKN